MLRPLPAERFDTTVVELASRRPQEPGVCPQCLYSVPARLVGRRVDVRVGAETVEVLDGAVVAASHARARKGDEVLVLDHYLEVLSSSPGRCCRPRRWPGPAPPVSFTADPRAVLGRRPAAGSATATAPRRSSRCSSRIGCWPLTRSSPACTPRSTLGVVDPAVVIIEARKHDARHDRARRPDRRPSPGSTGPPPTLDGYDDLLEAR